MSKTITLRPRLSEKTYAQSENRVYVVEIPTDVNKHGVARAIEAQFDVKVVKVNITNIRGKAKRTMSITGKRYLNSNGKRNDIKKAYVTLAEGQGLPFFAAVEEEEAQETKVQEQIDKAATKQAAKAEKKSRGGVLRRKKAEAK
jgi:large subunit ribosomal protein L23